VERSWFSLVFVVHEDKINTHHITSIRSKNRIAKILTANPALPRSKLRLRRSSLRNRLSVTHEIEMRYEESNAVRPSDVIWVYAMTEPMLIMERRIEMAVVTITQLRGISHFLET
jgi:hypothetical protein